MDKGMAGVYITLHFHTTIHVDLLLLLGYFSIRVLHGTITIYFESRLTTDSDVKI